MRLMACKENVNSSCYKEKNVVQLVLEWNKHLQDCHIQSVITAKWTLHRQHEIVKSDMCNSIASLFFILMIMWAGLQDVMTTQTTVNFKLLAKCNWSMHTHDHVAKCWLVTFKHADHMPLDLSSKVLKCQKPCGVFTRIVNVKKQTSSSCV